LTSLKAPNHPAEVDNTAIGKYLACRKEKRPPINLIPVLICDDY